MLHIPVQAGEEGQCGDWMIGSFKVSLSYISKAKVSLNFPRPCVKKTNKQNHIIQCCVAWAPFLRSHCVVRLEVTPPLKLLCITCSLPKLSPWTFLCNYVLGLFLEIIFGFKNLVLNWTFLSLKCELTDEICHIQYFLSCSTCWILWGFSCLFVCYTEKPCLAKQNKKRNRPIYADRFLAIFKGLSFAGMLWIVSIQKHLVDQTLQYTWLNLEWQGSVFLSSRGPDVQLSCGWRKSPFATEQADPKLPTKEKIR